MNKMIAIVVVAVKEEKEEQIRVKGVQGERV